MPTPYKREGDSAEEAWNELIRRVNELAQDCGLEELEEVEPKHRWARSDIREVQDKLTDICEENEFEEIPRTWKRRLIDEFTEALERGPCCCDQCKSFDVEFPYLRDTLGVLAGTHGTKFVKEIDLTGEVGEIDYTAHLEGLTDSGPRFWLITRYFDSGVWADTEIGVITRCGKFAPAHIKLGIVSEGAPIRGPATGKVSGRFTYHLLTCCQALEVRASCEDPSPPGAMPPPDTAGNDVLPAEEGDEIPLIIVVDFTTGPATVSGGTAQQTIKQPRWRSIESSDDTDDCGRCPDDPEYGSPCEESNE